MDSKRQDGSHEIRIWSAGCAGGEEAYSVAILLQQALAADEDDWSPLIFATDIDPAALEQAATGLYPRTQLQETRLGVVDEFFTPEDGGYRIRPFIQRMVRFSCDDLAAPHTFAPAESIFGGFDLVLCRNVLIYFSAALHDAVLAKLHRCLGTRGYLVLGEAEALGVGMGSRFDGLDARNRIYQKR